MQQCPNCNFKNRLGVIFCENCGASLIGTSALSTRSLGDESATALPPVEQAAIATIGADVFNDGTLLRIEIDGGTEPVLLKPSQEMIMGRRDPATGAMPDVDLTPFAGYRMGVSRRHAAIRSGEGNRLDVWDLGSSNGTFLNGTRLSSHRPYKLRDGDEVRLGQMAMKIYFQQTPPTVTPASPTSPVLPETPAAPATPTPPATPTLPTPNH